MTDRKYVESTVAYLAEHVPWMWHEFAAWMLREVCKDQPAASFAAADFHERSAELTKRGGGALPLSGSPKTSRISRVSSVSSVASAEWSLKAAEAATNDDAAGATEMAANSAAGEEWSVGWSLWAAWSKMADWLRSQLLTQGSPLVSADWWEERGEPKLAELLRQQAAE